MKPDIHNINDIDIIEDDALEDAQLQVEQRPRVLPEVDIDTIVANLNDWDWSWESLVGM